MRIFIRTSKWAIWARRLGSFALPLAIIPVLLHRQRLLESDVFVIAAGAAAIVAALALLVSVVALARLWRTGDLGWGRAISGLFLAAMCLAPFSFYAALALTRPAVTDIATAERGAMPLVFEPGTASMPAPRLLTAAERERLYPNATTRTYPLNVQQTYEVVARMIEARGWDVRMVHQPASPLGEGRINAQIVTLPGWREEAVLRIAAAADGASVDMRSASLNAEHDFGSNGARIEEFLTSLDTEVTVLLRDNPNATEPVEPVPEPIANPAAAPA